MRLKVSSAKWRPFCLGLNVLSEWQSMVTCKQMADHFTPVMWFHRGHLWLQQVQSNDMIKNCIWSETRNWYMYATWEIDPICIVLYITTSQGRVGGQIILLIVARLCFSRKTLWLVCRYVTEPFNGCLRQDGKDQQYLTAPIWKCMSEISDHRFTFLMDLLSNYTFYTNLTLFCIVCLLIEDVPSMIIFNLWKVEKTMHYRLKPV